jgi:ERCC4-type nuclease
MVRAMFERAKPAPKEIKMAITAVMIDSREPDWVQKLSFGGVPTVVTALDYGDLHVACDDGSILVIERKTPDDFLNTLKDERLFPQVAKCAGARHNAQIMTGHTDHIWPYLIITGQFYPGPNGKTVTPRGVTGWYWASVAGALLSVQEMGMPVVFAANDEDYEHTVILIAQRTRTPETLILPPRPPSLLGPAEQIVASLPGIGLERTRLVLESCGTPAWSLVALTDRESQIPGIPPSVKEKVRLALRLKDDEQIAIMPHGTQ